MEKYRANLPSDIFSDFWLVRTKWTPEKVVLFGPLEECSDAVQTTTQKAATHTHTHTQNCFFIVGLPFTVRYIKLKVLQ